MSYFVNTVKRLMDENKVRQVRISEKTDLGASHVSHIMREEQKSVAPEDVAKIAKVVGRTNHQQAEIIRSYLLDHIPTGLKSSNLISISIGEADQMKETHTSFRIPLAPDAEKALDTLARRAATDKNMQELLLRLAKYN